MLTTHDIPIRVRYQETDAQGHVHHATYINYFEQGRVELLRAAGHSYRELEEQGMMLVVVEVNCRYLRPAHFDDVLTLRTSTQKVRGTRIWHHYHVLLDDEIIVDANTTVACVNRDGRPQRLPQWLRDAPVADEDTKS
ncbi:MAG: acyl-CoA thioesterase [Pirellulales bacterium]|nr:acyl-CoA thioesterase [Pirellulales bacterium]